MIQLRRSAIALAILAFAFPCLSAWTTPALVATTAPVSHFGLQSIDGVSCGVGSRVLDKDATDATTRGIWVVAYGGWSRATDADTSPEMVHGNTIAVLRGVANHGKTFELSTADPITLGVTALTFTDITAPTSGDVFTTSTNTFTAATASPVKIKPSSAPSANTKLIDVQATGAGSTLFSVDAEGDCVANSFVGPLTGNASTVTNGVYTTGSYADPSWITSLAGSKISGAVASATTATNCVVADSSSAGAYVALFDGATGTLAPKTDTYLTYDATQRTLAVGATGFTGVVASNQVTTDYIDNLLSNMFINVNTPPQVAASVAGFDFSIQGGDAAAGLSTNGAAAGGNIFVYAGNADRHISGSAVGGSITLAPGAGIGGGANGSVILDGKSTVNGAMTVPTGGSIAVSGSGTIAATSATSATNVATTATSTNASYYPLFVASSSNSNQAASLDTTMTYNPSTDTLVVANVSGNASSATYSTQVPQNSQTSAYVLVAGDAGKHVSITTGGVTVNASVFSAGDIVSIFNNSGSNQTITQGSGVTIYLVGTATTGNRTLAQRGLATLLCITGGASPIFVISGGGVS